MILTDTGPLVALINPDDSHREDCIEIARTIGTEVMLTTWQCFTEVMHFLGRDGGYYLQENLWNMRRDGRLEILSTTKSEADRMDEFMRQYWDVPMDLADASLIAAAETLSFRRVFTTDNGFAFFRLADGSTLEMLQ